MLIKQANGVNAAVQQISLTDCHLLGIVHFAMNEIARVS
jgi:hypothetical protein